MSVEHRPEGRARRAPKPDHELIGETDFRLRDMVHCLGTKAIQAAAGQRKMELLLFPPHASLSDIFLGSVN